jgi:hypothetical protein
MKQKKAWTSVWLQLFCVCDCNQKLFVVAKPESVWLKATWLFGYLWLQAWVVCDCKNNIFVCDCKNYFVCVIANTADYFMTTKKIWTSVWLQLFCVCDCNQKLFVVASWLSLCGKKLLVIYDCKPEYCVIAKQQGRLWLQKLFCVCIANTAGYFMIAEKKNWTSVCLQLFCVHDCNQKLSVVAKPDCVCVVEKLFGYLVYDGKPE